MATTPVCLDAHQVAGVLSDLFLAVHRQPDEFQIGSPDDGRQSPAPHMPGSEVDHPKGHQSVNVPRFMTKPPSTVTSEPVTNSDSSEASQVAA